MGNGITNCYPDEVGKFISITVLRRIRHVLQRVEEAQQALDDDTLPNEKFEVVREGLKEEEQHAAGRLEAEARDVLGQRAHDHRAK